MPIENAMALHLGENIPHIERSRRPFLILIEPLLELSPELLSGSHSTVLYSKVSFLEVA
jgi:7,8-dihydro-6-hydroxymethylpterin-pyrophosphokinase